MAMKSLLPSLLVVKPCKDNGKQPLPFLTVTP